jgi:hypothetical protein
LCQSDLVNVDFKPECSRLVADLKPLGKRRRKPHILNDAPTAARALTPVQPVRSLDGGNFRSAGQSLSHRSTDNAQARYGSKSTGQAVGVHSVRSATVIADSLAVPASV